MEWSISADGNELTGGLGCRQEAIWEIAMEDEPMPKSAKISLHISKEDTSFHADVARHNLSTILIPFVKKFYKDQDVGVTVGEKECSWYGLPVHEVTLHMTGSVFFNVVILHGLMGLMRHLVTAQKATEVAYAQNPIEVVKGTLPGRNGNHLKVLYTKTLDDCWGHKNVVRWNTKRQSVFEDYLDDDGGMSSDRVDYIWFGDVTDVSFFLKPGR